MAFSFDLSVNENHSVFYIMFWIHVKVFLLFFLNSRRLIFG